MDKLNIEQVYIKSTKTISDGRIAEFFQSMGIEIQGLRGDNPNGYYFSERGGLIFSFFLPKNRVRINPWKRSYRKFPRLMMVSDNKIIWNKRMVYGKLQNHNYPFVAKESEPAKYTFEGWKYAKEIKEDLP